MAKILPFKRPGDVDFDRWLEQVQSENPTERSEAMESPPWTSPHRVEPYLIAGLKDECATVRLCAAESLGYFPSETTRDALMAYVEGETDEVARAFGMSSLGLVVSEEADLHDLLQRLMAATDELQRVHALMGIYHGARRLARLKITPALQSERPEIRGLAAEALVRLVLDTEGAEQVSDALAEAIDREENPGLRDDMSAALHFLENPDEEY